MALVKEAAELLEHFQWLTEEGSHSLEPAELTKIRHEIADVQIYLIRIADKLDINIPRAVDEKIKLNEERYPIEKAKGNAKKYTDL